MAVLQEYKCPCCDGAIEFDAASQNMKCPYCGSEFEMQTLQDYNKELNEQPQENMSWQTQAGSQWQEGEADGLRVYSCNTCGVEYDILNNKMVFVTVKGFSICVRCTERHKEGTARNDGEEDHKHRVGIVNNVNA